ncbi:neuroblast differentiation-associated protein AHNAK-like X2 [Biomphalaria pfeifferi]|uniref:Neuroblast differentiation-associated protein AHNAK-like X2 n=1 Tax=Biomphalaria pfeifferi TaxID=112525 RepID=A0AAD8BLA1_BIOPF|nr:neuroblast differentiation-associated protein AHNAK-like X2 [Biomphalaria pfeifferi]
MSGDFILGTSTFGPDMSGIFTSAEGSFGPEIPAFTSGRSISPDGSLPPICMSGPLILGAFPFSAEMPKSADGNLGPEIPAFTSGRSISPDGSFPPK